MSVRALLAYGSMRVEEARARAPSLFWVCPYCGEASLADHGGGHRECLVCGYDSCRDGVRAHRPG